MHFPKKSYYLLLAIPILAIAGYFLFHDFNPAKNTNVPVEVVRPVGGYFLEVRLVEMGGSISFGATLPVQILSAQGNLVQEKHTNDDGYVKFGLPAGTYTVRAVGNTSTLALDPKKITLNTDSSIQLTVITNVGEQKTTGATP